MYKFKIGDRVVFNDGVAFELGGKIGTICSFINGMRYEVLVDSIMCKYVLIPEHHVELLDLELLKEKNRLKEELRLVHIEIDPFGEEVW